MRLTRFARYVVGLLLMVLAAPALVGCAKSVSVAAPSAQGHCSVTLSPGQDVAGTVASASQNAVICLQAGSYPTLKLSGVKPSGYVTLRSAHARQANFDGIEGQNVSFLRLEKLTVHGPVSILQSAHDLQLVNNDIGPGTCGVYLYAWQHETFRRVTIAQNYIHDLDFTGPEGVCSGYGIEAVGGVGNVQVTNNTIAHVANDYVQLGGGENWTVAHNLFLGPSLRQSHGTVHQDLWQVFGGGANLRFANNVARNTETQESLLFQEGVYHNVRVENNLFDHDSSGYSVQMFQVDGLTFTYNTFVGSTWGVIFRADDPDAGRGQGYVVEHNIFGSTSGGTPDVSEYRAFGIYDYNVSQDGSASGPHSVRHWRARWSGKPGSQPRCLTFAAGYHPTSSTAQAAFNRRWRSGCS